MLPIRPLRNVANDAVASLLVNQASISVVSELGTFLAERVRPFHPDVIIGLPTLGLSLAPIVAQHLGLSKGFIKIPHLLEILIQTLTLPQQDMSHLAIPANSGTMTSSPPMYHPSHLRE